MSCIGHEKEGYGLDWNKKTKGSLLSSADDGLICRYDVEKKPEKTTSKTTDGSIEMDPVQKFKAHEGVVVSELDHYSNCLRECCLLAL